MSLDEPEPQTGGELDPAETYDICLLVEQPLSRADAQQIVDLHSPWADPVHYHVLMPMEDAAANIEAALGTLAAGEVMAPSPLSVLSEEAELARRQAAEVSESQCEQCLATLADLGASADAEIVSGPPVHRLVEAVEQRGSREVIILTRPHLVAELFHTDWTHQARRHLGVPVLHLLAHQDPR